MSISELLRIAAHLDPAGRDLVQRAYERAVVAHTGQRRLSGEDYVQHPLEVASILADLTLDGSTIAAALLHDTVEDTPLTLEEIRRDFGPDVAHLVEGVTKLSRISFRSAQQIHAENIRKMLLAMAEDLRAVLIKLADRLHNMRTLDPLLAIRVQVDSVKDCYGVLGVVHSLWKRLPGRFKDFIAMSKSNGYQSLHTTVISHSGEPIEIQIRTSEMHRIAEFGVAAHWAYKEGTDGPIDQKLSWLRLLMEWQKEVVDAESFVDAVRVDLFQDEVFVFSPKGDVYNLPAGSTPVDFAYRVHTEVGHRCLGGKVNGRMVPLDYELKNGEIVEILTTKASHGPSRDWLSFVKSASARERIRKWFKSQAREENVAKGRDLLEKELLRMHRLTLAQLPEGKLEEMARATHFQSVEDFLAAI